MDKLFFLQNFCNNYEQKNSFLLYYDLLCERQKNINLVSSKSLEDGWKRHFIDSAQIIKHIFPKNNFNGLIDIGSGAGFPGLVISLLGFSPVYLVETNRHKAAFLSDVIRITGSKAKVLNEKIERVVLPEFNFVVSRAFASLNKLFTILEQKRVTNVKCIFPKGRTYNNEIKETKKNWNIRYTTHKSITNSHSKIVIVEDFKRVK
ncbi:MAG: Ribosomal RNA small subunit methyltransferase G [Alphaproteobacteria bacterium MarineAlpha2_Bin1]|nr:MAG: Ribosomal RNA small subunit methyltransferase G [Alphaproteobacteria bacterium MarineAlpha2_Bin1]